MPKISPIIFCLLLSLVLVPEVLADVQVEQGGSKVSVHVQNRVNSNNSVSINNETGPSNISIHQTGDGNSKLVVNNDVFTLSGTIKSVSGNVVDVSGQNITIDSSKVSGFKQNTGLVPGENITLNGAIIDGTFYAREINSTGSNNSSSSSDSSPTPQTSASPSPNPDSSFQPIQFPSEFPFSSSSPNISGTTSAKAETKAQGPISKLIDVLQAMIASLQKLL